MRLTLKRVRYRGRLYYAVCSRGSTGKRIIKRLRDRNVAQQIWKGLSKCGAPSSK